MDESIKMQLRESYSMRKMGEEFEAAGKRLAELEQAEKELGETQLLLIEEQERNQRLIQRLAAVELERDELKGAYILLDGLKRRIRSAFEYWPDLAMHKDLSVLLNTRPSQQVINKFAIEQQIKAVEYCYKNIPDLADSDYVKLKRRAEQLRQQLNGGE